MAYKGGMTTRYRSILYNFSAGKFASGDLIALNIQPPMLRSLRNDFLNLSKGLGDLQSIANKSIPTRLQRRVAGRAIGRVGGAIIPQGFGPFTRLANRAYGRQSSRAMNNDFTQGCKKCQDSHATHEDVGQYTVPHAWLAQRSAG